MEACAAAAAIPAVAATAAATASTADGDSTAPEELLVVVPLVSAAAWRWAAAKACAAAWGSRAKRLASSTGASESHI